MNISTEITEITPNVFRDNGIVYTTSHDVAQYFERRHDHVLESIGDLLGLPEIGETPDRYFVETRRTEPQNGVSYRAYNMTRDGFTILAMGFKGKRAIRFRLAYVDAFNQMEAALTGGMPRHVKPPVIAGARLSGALVSSVHKMMDATLAACPDLAPPVRQAVIGEFTKLIGVILPPPVIDSKLFTATQLATTIGITTAALSRDARYQALKIAPNGINTLVHDSLNNPRSTWNWSEQGRAAVLATFMPPLIV
jgi:Rha family phage regulatory protein